MAGVGPFITQFDLTLTVTPSEDVIAADHTVNPELEQFWPRVRGAVMKWKFTPFKVDGKAATVSVSESADLVPPQRLPTRHVTPPVLRPDSKITITLYRGICFGACPVIQGDPDNEGH